MRIGYDAKRIFHNTTGLGNYSRDLVRIMAEFYPENNYFLYNPKPAKINRLSIKSNMHIKQPSGFFARLFPSLWRYKWILKDLEKDRIDIYHGLSAELPAGIEKKPIKSVVTIHDLIFMYFPKLYSTIDRKIYFKKFLKAVHSADIVVAISEQTKKDILKYSNIPASKVKVIYQGCHTAFKRTYSKEFIQKVLEKYKLPKKFFLNVGTIEPRKNALSIVKALQPTDYHIVLVGKLTSYALEIKKYVTNHQMENRVHFLTGLSLEELAVLYQQAQIFIYPSLYEGFGIPLIEALYSKTIVITNKNGVFPEAAGPFSFYLEDVQNPKEIRDLIEQIVNKDVSEQIENSYKFVQKFNDDEIARQWKNLYCELL